MAYLVKNCNGRAAAVVHVAAAGWDGRPSKSSQFRTRGSIAIIKTLAERMRPTCVTRLEVARGAVNCEPPPPIIIEMMNDNDVKGNDN